MSISCLISFIDNHTVYCKCYFIAAPQHDPSLLHPNHTISIVLTIV